MNQGGAGRVRDGVGERLEVIQRGPNTARGEARWLTSATIVGEAHRSPAEGTA